MTPLWLVTRLDCAREVMSREWCAFRSQSAAVGGALQDPRDGAI